ncbi:MAG: UbiD family decarboxylase [Chitinivibrionales bacterium]|nr:UbiD family decarboxylase [Chitinivibrionales bacterium]
MELRNFIDSLERAGQLERIANPVHWKYDLGAYARAHRRPLLFENIREYPGFYLFTNGLCAPAHIARALALPAGISRNNLIAALRERLQKPRAPTMVPHGAFRENTLDTLLKLPVPWWHRADGGRYLGTWHVNVTRDPISGVQNCGIYRMQLLGGDSATLSVSPRSHLALHFAAAEKAGTALPMAVCIGVGECCIMAAAAAFPANTCEYDYAGGLQEKPLELAACHTIDLAVPATAEIVVEGLVQPGVRVGDGPFFDYAGVPNVNPQALLFTVTAIGHRTRPIFRGSAVGRAGAEDHQLFSLLAPLGLVDFHGSPKRQAVQNFLLQNKMFRTLQGFTRLGHLLHRPSHAVSEKTSAS